MLLIALTLLVIQRRSGNVADDAASYNTRQSLSFEQDPIKVQYKQKCQDLMRSGVKAVYLDDGHLRLALGENSRDQHYTRPMARVFERLFENSRLFFVFPALIDQALLKKVVEKYGLAYEKLAIDCIEVDMLKEYYKNQRVVVIGSDEVAITTELFPDADNISLILMSKTDPFLQTTELLEEIAQTEEDVVYHIMPGPISPLLIQMLLGKGLTVVGSGLQKLSRLGQSVDIARELYPPDLMYNSILKSPWPEALEAQEKDDLDTETLLTIVIPVYNAERTMNMTLNSLLAQTAFGDVQIVLVNDASTDSSLRVLRQYQRVHSLYDGHIRIVDLKTNTGCANARYEGTKAATTKYIMYIDADDWLKGHYALEEILATLVSPQYDIVHFYSDHQYANPRTQITLKGNARIRAAYSSGQFKQTVWGKVLRRDQLLIGFERIGGDFMAKNHINYGEDILIITPVVQQAQNYTVLNATLYKYLQNQDSVSRGFPYAKRGYELCLITQRLFETVLLTTEEQRQFVLTYERHFLMLFRDRNELQQACNNSLYQESLRIIAQIPLLQRFVEVRCS